MQTPTTLVVTLTHTASPDAENSRPYGSYIVKAQVLDEKEKAIDKAEITMTRPDGSTKTRIVDTTTTLHSKDFYAAFDFTPQGEDGQYELTFSSPGLDASLTIDAQ